MHLSCPGREQNPRSLNPHTGSVRALTNSAGSVTDRYAYDAFGSALATTGSTTNAYRFTGEQQDAALGMYELRAKYDQNMRIQVRQLRVRRRCCLDSVLNS